VLDFSLTSLDETILSLVHEERELGRRFAREKIRREDLVDGIHPAVAHREDPLDVLDRVAAETSGVSVVKALALMVSANDAPMRRNRDGYLGTNIVTYAGSAEQKRRFGRLKLAISITEPGAGSDVSNIRASAKYDPATEEWILNGEKIYCSYFGHADGAVVLMRGEGANGNRPFLPFVVTKELPGLKIVRQVKTMSHPEGGDHWDFVMEDVRVSALHKIDADMGRTLLALNNTRPMVAASGLGICRSMLDFTRKSLKVEDALDYTRSRTSRSVVENRLIEMEALFEAAKMTVLRVKWLEQQSELAVASSFKVEAAICKALAGRAVREITQGCLELLGPQGLSEDHLAEKWFRDARIYDIFEGAGEINRLIIARDVLSYSRRELD
jgi:acyl-CoA dehydrogenase